MISLPKSWTLFKQKEYDDMIFYKVHCECLDDEHSQTLILEYDNQNSIITSTIAGEMNVGAYSQSRFKNFFKRIWLATKMLFTGRLAMEGSVLIIGADNVEHMFDSLKIGLNKMRHFENKLIQKNQQAQRDQDETN